MRGGQLCPGAGDMRPTLLIAFLYSEPSVLQWGDVDGVDLVGGSRKTRGG